MRNIIVIIICLSLPRFGITQPLCPAATNLRASEIGNTKATLSWETAPEYQNLNVQIEFKVNQVNGGPYQSASSVYTGNTYLLTGLQPGTRYVFRVSIYKSGCFTNWAYSPEFTTTICDNPVLLNANVTGSAATLSWINPGSATSIAEYKESSSTTWKTIINVSSAPNGSAYVSGLASGTIYDWRVKNVCNNNGIITTTAYSTSQFQTSCTLSPPGGIYCTSTTNSITLNWALVNGATSYSIEYKPASSPNWISYGNFSTNTATILGLISESTYNWKVKANCPSGSSAFSESTCTTTTACNIPSGLTCVFSNTNYINVKWNPVPSATTYYVMYKLTGSSDISWQSISTSGTAQASIMGLSSSKSYDIKVQAKCGNTMSSFSAPITCTTSSLVKPCIEPAGLTVSAISSNSATLSWAAEPGATAYDVYLVEPDAMRVPVAINYAGGNAVSINTLSPSTTYWWEMRSVCNLNNSPYSYLSFTTLPSGSNRITVESTDDRQKVMSGEKDKLTIYPNPPGNYFNVQLPVVAANCTISIYDQNGKNVLVKTVARGIVQLDISNLAKGLYIVVVSNSNNEVLSRSKIVKQ